MFYIIKIKKEIEKIVVIEANSDEEADRFMIEDKNNFSTEHVLTKDDYNGYEYISCETTNEPVITSEKDLEDYFGTSDIERVIFKYTTCGCCYTATKDYISVNGYAEGSGDAECPEHRLYFPFKISEFDSALEEADREGCELFEECNEFEDEE